jgi:hypothetical protein
MDSENPVPEDNRAINTGGESNRRANDAAIPNGHKSPPESIIEMAKTLAGVLVVLLAPFMLPVGPTSINTIKHSA